MTEFLWFIGGWGVGLLSVAIWAAIYVRVRGSFTVSPPQKRP